MRDFKKYDIWKISHELVLSIYDISNDFPQSEIFGLTSQIRRASASVPTNIAEGCGRTSDAEFSRFLTIALGSATETEYLIILAKDLEYIDSEIYETLSETVNHIKRKIYSLQQKL